MRSKAFNVRIDAYGRTRPESFAILAGFCIPIGLSGREGKLRFFLARENPQTKRKQVFICLHLNRRSIL